MPENPDIRWRQRLQSFRRAFAQLAKAAVLAKQRELSELERQGLIQAFEFTHELAWNVLKDYLQEQGYVDLIGSRDATRQAFRNGLLHDGEAWMGMIKNRNRSSHTYNEDTAAAIAAAILSSYVPEYEKFLVKFTEIESRDP